MSGHTSAGAGDRERTALPGPVLEGEPPATTGAPGAASSAARLAVAAGEAGAALGAAALAVALSRTVVVDPLDRVGQVSGIAALDLHMVVIGLLVVASCVVAARGSAGRWRVVSRLACAVIAGLATGLVAGGILLALRGTDWPLFANWGDSGQLIRWADDIVAGRPVPASYPPFVLHLIAGLSELTGDSTANALRTVQVIGTAAFGPVAYLSWRLLLSPVWALTVALVAAMPLLEPYKPYTTVPLVALVPVLIAFLRVLRRAQALTWPRMGLLGIGTGAVLGGLFCVYSGWFVWSAPGVLIAMLIVFPWRAALRGLALLGLAAAGFAAVAAPHVVGLLRAAGTVQDRFFYFDTFTDPAYIAMWRNDLPGDTGPWPPPGELAGVGVFPLLLVLGLGAAVALGARRTSVYTLCCLLAGAWVMRFWIASQMYATQSVQLYPRTSAEILYCLLVLTVLAVLLAVRRGQQLLALRGGGLPTHENGFGPDPTPWRPAPAATIGALSAALLLALWMGSAVADRYMPRDDNSVGLLAYVAQMVRQPDGSCPDYSAPAACAPTVGDLLNRDRG